MSGKKMAFDTDGVVLFRRWALIPLREVCDVAFPRRVLLSPDPPTLRATQSANIAKLILVSFPLALIALGTDVRAHHSFAAEFDANKPFKVTGTVTNVEWMNPHIFFHVDVVEEQTKKVINWTMELGSPNNLMRNGWTRNSLRIGDIVTVEGSQARDGKTLGSPTVIIMTKTGQRLLAGVNDSPTP